MTSYIEDNLNNRLGEIKQSIIKQELANYKTLIGDYDFKSSILIIYAHWEGFIKFSSSAYLNEIKKLNIPFSSVKNNFWTEYKNSVINKQTKFLDDLLLGNFGKTNSLKVEINTGGNLKYSIFQGQILKVIGFDYNKFLIEIFPDIIELFLQNDKYNKDPTIRRRINKLMSDGKVFKSKDILEVRKLLKPYKLGSLGTTTEKDLSNLEKILSTYIDDLVSLRNQIAHGEKVDSRDQIDIQLFGDIVRILLLKFSSRIELSIINKEYLK